MRKKISKEKEDLKRVVEEISSYSELCNVENISVEDGIFPCQPKTQQTRRYAVKKMDNCTSEVLHSTIYIFIIYSKNGPRR